jgi:Uncharacterized conserved protein
VIATRYALGGVAYLVGTIAAASVSLAIRDVMIDSNAGRDMWDHLVRVALVVTPAYLVALAVTVFNSLASLRNMVERGRANIDVQLKRRQDLLPNLEAVVKAHAKHEQKVLNRIVEARAAAADTAKPGSWRAIAPSILLIAERYPSLQANTAFLDLQQHVADTEHRIALARAYYVDLATAYNTRLRIVPDAWIAWLGGLRPAPLMPDTEYERIVERVHLADSD